MLPKNMIATGKHTAICTPYKFPPTSSKGTTFASTFLEKIHFRRSSSTWCKKKCLMELNVQSMFEARQKFKSLSFLKQREWILHIFKSMAQININEFHLDTKGICRAAWQFIYGISNKR